MDTGDSWVSWPTGQDEVGSMPAARWCVANLLVLKSRPRAAWPNRRRVFGMKQRKGGVRRFLDLAKVQARGALTLPEAAARISEGRADRIFMRDDALTGKALLLNRKEQLSRNSTRRMLAIPAGSLSKSS